MELETKLPLPDRETRRIIEDNFQKIQDEINEIESRKKLEKRVNHIEDLLKLYGITEEGTK